MVELAADGENPKCYVFWKNGKTDPDPPYKMSVSPEISCGLISCRSASHFYLNVVTNSTTDH